MLCIAREMIAKTRLIFLTMIIAMLTFRIVPSAKGIIYLTQSVCIQGTGGTPIYNLPPS